MRGTVCLNDRKDVTQEYLRGLLLALWLVLYYCFVRFASRGKPVEAVTMVLLASPLGLMVFAMGFEHRTPPELINFSTGSWSLMIGDTFVLTTAAAVSALSWRTLDAERRVITPARLIACGVIGLAAGVGFHALDGAGYKALGAGALLDSPTKLFHDFVSYPVLFGGLLCVGLPVLRRKSWHRWVLLGCIAAWMVLVGFDISRGLDPFDLHVPWDPDGFMPIG